MMHSKRGDSGGEVHGPPEGSLEWRASLALKVLAGINVAGMILALFPGFVTTSTLGVVAFHAASGTLAVLYLLVARGIDRRQHWAESAIRPMLVLLLLWGVYLAATTIAASQVRIPFTALVAGWALLRPAAFSPFPRFDRRGATALVATVALIALELASQPLFGWGGFFDVHERDLSASLSVDCGTPGPSLPDRIALTYEWSWSGTALLANADDVVVIGWSGDDAEGHPLYVLDDAPEPGEGIHLGSVGHVSASMGEEAARHWGGSLRWDIDLADGGIRPGRIEVVLRRAAEQPPEPQPLSLGVTYVHVGAWRNDVPMVTCSW